MENEPDDSIEIFGYEVDKDDALHASQAMVLGGALLRANANNKEKQQKAEIARREENRRKEIQQAADEKARQERIFDEANDPCPYCQTQISKQAALCPSCRNGFFGAPWGLINLAITKNPLLVENVTAEAILSATANVRDEYEAILEAQAEQRRLENEAKAIQNQKMVEEREKAAKRKVEQEKIQDSKKYKFYAIGAGLFAALQLVGLLSGGGGGPFVLAAFSGYLSYYWLKKSNNLSEKNLGHWSEKRGL
jgi:hypothetical protein